MRCSACNRLLTDFEATRKSASTGEYIDLCNKCFSDVVAEIDVLEREDLRNVEEDYDDEDYDDEFESEESE